MELFKKSLCDSYIDYQPLLSNLAYIKTILLSGDACKLSPTDQALLILKDLFYDIGQWYKQTVDPPISCFKDLPIYYNTKCGCKIVYWVPNINDCVQKVADTINGEPVEITGFKQLADLFASYLGYIAMYPDGHTIQEVLSIINAFCDILKQRIIIDNTFIKNLLNVS